VSLDLPLHSHKNRFPSKLFCVTKRIAKHKQNDDRLQLGDGDLIPIRAEFFLLPAASGRLWAQPTCQPVPDVISRG